MNKDLYRQHVSDLRCAARKRERHLLEQEVVHLQSLSLLIVARQKLVVWLLGLSIVAPLYIVELFDGELGLYSALVFVVLLFAAHTANRGIMITTLDF